MQDDQFTHRMQLIQAQKDFENLKLAQHIPPLMLAKLNFLSALIDATRPDENVVEQLPFFERQALQQLHPQAQAGLFISIVSCLAGKEEITYFRRERAYLRREKGFFGWKKCYLDCSTHKVRLFESRAANLPFQLLQVSQMWVSRHYKYYKKKTIFAVYHQNIKYVLGFDQEGTCKKVHEIFTSLVSEHRQWQCTKYDPQQIQQPKGVKLGLESRKVEEHITTEQLQYLKSLQNRLNSFDLSDSGFKLLKNIEHGRILINEKKSSVRISLILKDLDELSLLENYVLQQWNSNIQASTVVGKPRSNSFLTLLRTGKYSYLSYPRECHLSVIYYQPCSCRSQPSQETASYLLIQSVPSSDPPTSGAVQMQTKQVIEVAKSPQDPALLLMTITVEADFKGYASPQDNINMALHLLGNLSDLVAYTTKHPHHGMFEKTTCPCKQQTNGRSSRIISDFSLPSQQNFSNQDDLSDGETQRKAVKKHSLKNRQKQVLIQLQALLGGVRNEAILELMRLKRHEGYALKHRFTHPDEAFHREGGENNDFLLQGKKWQLKNDQFQFIDEQALAAQKDILKMIIKQLGSNLLAGKSIMNMSLPVEIFDTRSMLDVIADSLGFLPHYLTRAANSSDPVEQVKLVTCAMMFLSATAPDIKKPFNPILGETFQGQIGEFSVALQQVSHHPAISAIYMRNKSVIFHGNFEVSLDMGLNSAYSKVNNWFHLHLLHTDSHFKVKVPDLDLGGLMYGARTLKFVHRGYVYETNSRLFCQMSIGKDKKRIYERPKLGPADLAGGIFKVRPQFGQKVMQQTGKKAFDGLKPEDVEESKCFLSGKWYGNLNFDEVPYKSITDGPFPQKCNRLRYLLPSDAIFRQDVIFKIWKDNEGSNREKERLQNIQRGDRKLRQRLGPKSDH